MSLHFPLPKTRTFRFSFHTSRLSLHGEVTIVALKFAMSSHFPLPKSRTTSDRKPKTNDQILPSHFRKGGSVSVREVRSVRDREREIDGSDVTIVAIKLAMSFALFLAKSLHLSIGEEFCTFPCQKFAPSFLLS